MTDWPGLLDMMVREIAGPEGDADPSVNGDIDSILGDHTGEPNMDISIKIIPHDQQRYETAGDWWFDDAGNLQIRVSDMGNWKHESLVAFHELAEVLLCKDRGISTETVDAFDARFETERAQGMREPDAEPGDDPAAPYRREHFFATNVERLLAGELGADWERYDAAIAAL